jgi:YHS domain-containing protein
VNDLSRIIRAVLSTLLVGGILSLLRLSMGSLAPVANRRMAPAGPVPLYRDPSCGTFISPEISFRAEHAGRVVHFCSEQCRDDFLRGRS